MIRYLDSHGIVFIHIPKCASTTLSNLTSTWEELSNFEDISNLQNRQNINHIICVFRDPYQRFLSSLNMVMQEKYWEDRNDFMSVFPFHSKNSPFFQENDPSAFFKFSTTDAHFTPQSWEVRQYEEIWPGKVRYFWMSNSVLDDIIYFLKNVGVNKEDMHYQGDRHLNKSRLKYVTGVCVDLIKNFYKEDYQYIDFITKNKLWQNESQFARRN